MNVGETQSAAAIGLPVAPVLEVRERFGSASVLVQVLLLVFGLGVFSVASIPAAAFLGVAIALRLAWMLTHRRSLVWDGHDVWFATGRSKTHAARGGTGEIRQIAVRRAGNPGTTVIHRYYVVVNAAGAGSVRLPISQWDEGELARIAAAANIPLTDYGLIPASEAAIVDRSPAGMSGLAALGVFAIAIAIAWFTQR